MPLKTPGWWKTNNALSTLLLPAAVFYGACAARRNVGITPETVGVPVICIGNAVAGGAGKTPLALSIGAWMKARGVRAFFVTRGYGGSEKGPLSVNPLHHTAQHVGDEPLLLARVLPTFMAKNRMSAVHAAINAGAELVILDDGLQDARLSKTLSLLAVDGTYGFGNGRLLPAGPLREPAESALARVNAAVVIGGDFTPNGAALLRATLTPTVEAHHLRGQRVVGFAGLGQPDKFRATLESLGCIITSFHGFADHHPYTHGELEQLRHTARTEQAMLVTTEKDKARLTQAAGEHITAVPVRLAWQNPAALDALLEPLCP